MTTVAAAVLKNEQGEILICQRGAGGSCAYLWEFPGGKLEPGETLEQCAVRECREELNVDIAVKGVLSESVYEYPERKIQFTFFSSEIKQGNPLLKVHSAIKWVKPAELKRYPFCPADQELVESLSQNSE
ncbi:MAG: 8-oxo-dGTP diphosphatase MutT [Ruminococcaceae bacterium]|jgi:8-oxo-dGTP diphosphatase|nr:8-oxo-dGTP diphosphatase MutT [Oscillospiraceae bacterium]